MLFFHITRFSKFGIELISDVTKFELSIAIIDINKKFILNSMDICGYVKKKKAKKRKAENLTIIGG